MPGTWFAIAVCLLAAGGVFLVVSNRTLLFLRDGPLKTALVGLTLVGLGAVAVLAGLAIGDSWWVFAPLAIVLLLALGELRRWALRRGYRASPPVDEPPAPTPWCRPVTTTELAVRRYRVPAAGRLRVAHVSDLHYGDSLPEAYYREVMDRAAEAEPDLLLLTGDFVTEARFADQLPALLGRARGRFGTFAVLGNHDYWADATRVRAALSEAGVDLIGDGYRRVRVGDAREVTLFGCEAPWSKRARVDPPPDTARPRIALTHTPDNVYDLSAAGADAIFCGHTHAGQGRLPGLGSVAVPSRYGRRFDHGHFRVNGAHLFVTAGIGAVGAPLRLYCPPDLFVVDFGPDLRPPEIPAPRTSDDPKEGNRELFVASWRRTGSRMGRKGEPTCHRGAGTTTA